MLFNVAFFGDVIGKPGRRLIKENISDIKKKYNLNLFLVNGENSAGGRGVDGKSLKELYDCGVEFITLGDHTFYQNEFDSYLNENKKKCIRPLNYPGNPAGAGFSVVSYEGLEIAICNLIGRVGMGLLVDCPYKAFDKFFEATKNTKIKLVDFHAEATSEKNAMAHYIDGRASLLVGTHTHVQTADERIFENGLGYITDLGMCGPINSVIGMDKDIALFRLTTGRNKHYKIAKGEAMLNGVFASIDPLSGVTKKIERIKITH